MKTLTIKIENADREDLRLIIAAIRDKRAQCLESAQRGSEEAGDQAHRLAGVLNDLTAAYRSLPSPKAGVTLDATD